MNAPSPPAEVGSVIDFWREVGPKMWFAKDPGFDGLCGERFLARHEAAARGELADWRATPVGALALVLLLDQYPRNAFRDTPRMYATDALAREVADAAIAAGHDRTVANDLAVVYYLPFGIPKRCPTRSDASSSPNAWAIRTTRAPSITATSSAGSAAFPIATPSSAASRRPRSSDISTRAVTKADGWTGGSTDNQTLPTQDEAMSALPSKSDIGIVR